MLDLGDNGRHEFILWGSLAGFATSSRLHYGLGCEAEWPLIFAWTGNTYSEVSNQYKDYYRGYFKSVTARLATYSSVLAPAATPTANPAPEIGNARIAGHFAVLSSDAGGEGVGQVIAPVPVTPAPAPSRCCDTCLGCS
jgi:hypothetical protein